MKNKWFLLLAVVVFSTTVNAQTRPGFELGVEGFDYGYRETFEGDTAKDDGNFLGFSVGYTKKFGDTFLRGRLSIDFGSVDYSADETRVNDVDQQIGQLELHLGRDFRLKNGATIAPFAGIGSRILDDNSGGTESNDGLLGYDRTVGYRYVPVGVAANIGRFTLSGQYNWLIGGQSKSYFSKIDPETPDVTVDLNDGSGYELSAMFNYKRFSVGPFVRHWSIDQSKSFTVDDEFDLFEPENSTTETGIRVKFAF